MAAEDKTPVKANDLSDNIGAVLNQVPEGEREIFERFIGMSLSVGSTISPQAELTRKITPENIDNYLLSQNKANELEYKKERDLKILIGVIVSGLLVVMPIIVFLLRDQPDIIANVLYVVGAAALGIMGGYGISKKKK